MLIVALLGLFPALVAYAAVSDLLTMRIPNWLSLALVAAFAMFALAGGLPWDAVLMHVAAAALVLTVCFTMFALGWIGGGDAKLAAATSLWLGFSSLLEYLLIAAVAGVAVPPASTQERHPLWGRARPRGPCRISELARLARHVWRLTRTTAAPETPD